MQQSADKTHAPVILHLLHGTWSPGAAWTQPGSELRRSLEREFRDSVQIDVIRWTGRNRDADRNSAAEQVIPKLRQQNGVHFLVSHSHGGNVAVYAALDPDLRREGRVAGVICMNTPLSPSCAVVT